MAKDGETSKNLVQKIVENTAPAELQSAVNALHRETRNEKQKLAGMLKQLSPEQRQTLKRNIDGLRKQREESPADATAVETTDRPASALEATGETDEQILARLSEEIDEAEKTIDDTPAKPTDQKGNNNTPAKPDNKKEGTDSKPAFFEQFTKADTAGKLSLVVEKVAEFTEKITDFLSSMGSSALLSIATFMEAIGFDKTWINQIRAFAGSEKSIIQEQLKANGMVLIKDEPKSNDTIALNKLRGLFNAEKAKIPVVVAPTPAPQPATTPATPSAPAAAPAAPAVPAYTFEQYMNEQRINTIVRESQANLADDQGRKVITLTQIVNILQA